MFGPITAISIKVLESYPLKLKVKEPYPNKIKSKAMMKDMFISNILTDEAMLQSKMSYKQVTRNTYLAILLTAYHEELMARVIFSISPLNFFFQSSLLNLKHLHKKKIDDKQVATQSAGCRVSHVHLSSK